MIEIPLTTQPEQKFNITLSGLTYELRVIVNSRLKLWTVSFAQNGIDLVNGITMVSGVDLMIPYNLPFDNMYIVNLDNSNLDPDKDTLGINSKLVILTDEEVTVEEVTSG